MTVSRTDNKLIAKNTLMLYIRLLFNMAISFYTSRVILDVLGVTDYGINNVVAGTASMFSFINLTMAGATSRFLVYDLGVGDMQKLKKTFSATITIHLALSIIIFILCEIVGLYFLQYKLDIPENRLIAAHIVFQFSVLSGILAVTQVPYNASIIAHEKMDVFAIMSIVDVSLKLLIVFMLEWFDVDKLILYGALFLILSAGMMLAYRYYCYKHFPECRFRLTSDRKVIKPLLVFSAWDLYGNMSVSFKSQGVNIIQNMFWGPAINAATGIAHHVVNTIVGFSRGFNTAIQPQIVKNYAIGNIEEMTKLAIRCSKFSFYLLILISFPALLKLNDVLEVWLTIVPDYTYQFCQLVIISNWFLPLMEPLTMIIHATGRMKRISFISGSIFLMALPITYILLYLGGRPSTPFLLDIIVAALVYISNLMIVKRYIPQFPVRIFLYKAVLVPFGAVALGALLPIIVCTYFKKGLAAFFIVCAVAFLSELISVTMIGVNKNERKQLFLLVKSRFKK